MRRAAGIVVIGPSGRGGIAQVIRIWKEAGFLAEHRVKYLESTADHGLKKTAVLFKSFFEYLLILIRGCDLVYIHCAGYRSFYRKVFFICTALLFKKKTVLHIHGEFSPFISDLRPKARKFIFPLLEGTSAFVVLTETLKQDLLHYFPGKTIFVLKNPVNTHEITRGPRPERERDKILYLGWYIREKGVFDLVDAMEILANEGESVRLCFYGTKGAERLRDYVRRKRLCDRVSVNGWVDEAEKIDALRTSSVLVLPSYSEGVPNVVLEAMAAGTPVVATAVGGLKEILQDGENAVVAGVGNPRDLSRKILACLKDDALRIKISENAYRDISANYGCQVIKEKLSKIVSTVLEGETE